MGEVGAVHFLDSLIDPYIGSSGFCYFAALAIAVATELIIYTDESDKEGDYFSHFYGGRAGSINRSARGDRLSARL